MRGRRWYTPMGMIAPEVLAAAAEVARPLPDHVLAQYVTVLCRPARDQRQKKGWSLGGHLPVACVAGIASLLLDHGLFFLLRVWQWTREPPLASWFPCSKKMRRLRSRSLRLREYSVRMKSRTQSTRN